MDKQLLLSRERLLAAFQQFDTDGSGKITNEELAKVIHPSSCIFQRYCGRGSRHERERGLLSDFLSSHLA